jgi:hypothetical protein
MIQGCPWVLQSLCFFYEWRQWQCGSPRILEQAICYSIDADILLAVGNKTSKSNSLKGCRRVLGQTCFGDSRVGEKSSHSSGSASDLLPRFQLCCPRQGNVVSRFVSVGPASQPWVNIFPDLLSWERRNITRSSGRSHMCEIPSHHGLFLNQPVMSWVLYTDWFWPGRGAKTNAPNYGAAIPQAEVEGCRGDAQ